MKTLDQIAAELNGNGSDEQKITVTLDGEVVTELARMKPRKMSWKQLITNVCYAGLHALSEQAKGDPGKPTGATKTGVKE